MKFISVKLKKHHIDVLINIGTISSIYEDTDENCSVIGTTTHGNGGFYVVNKKDDILSAIMQFNGARDGVVKVR